MHWLSHLTTYLSSVLLLTLGSTVSAAAPQLKFLYPAGAQRGATVEVTCNGEFDWPVDVWAPGAKVTRSKEKGKLEISVAKDLAADRIWIRLYNDEGVSAALPFMLGNLPETQEKEPNDLTSKAQPMAEFAAPPSDSEVTINGVLQKNGDVDAFAVQLVRGQTLVAAIEANTAFGSPIDSILQIVSPTGEVVAENHDDVGLDPRLAYTAPSDGRYVARVFAFPSAPNQSIRFHGGADCVYRLTLTTGPFITHSIPMAVTAQAGKFIPQTVEVGGWNIPTGSRLPIQPFYESSSRQSSGQSGLVLAPNWSGSTRVRLTPLPVIAELARTTEQEPLYLAVPVSLAGTIEKPRAADHYRLKLTTNQQLRISVDALRLHSPLAPQLRLVGPDGKVAAEATTKDAAGDVELSYKATVDGEYRLTVQDRFQHGGPRYHYRLTTEQPAPDFSLSLDTDNFTVSAAKPTEIVVNIKRESGVGKTIGDIEVTAVGLPEGVTAAPMLSQSKGETSKKVTLKLQAADGQSFTERFRIQGRAVESGLMRNATTIEKYQARFDRLWLTVKPEQETESKTTPE